jgi:DNA invertase Pin-like site-specific DNA recombinase
MHALAKKRIELHCIKQNFVTKGLNDIATKVFINAFATAAEIEHGLISQHTKNVLALAKQKGKKLGNPNLAADYNR